MSFAGRRRTRRSEIRQRRKRREKIKKLRDSFKACRNEEDRRRIVSKLLKMSPEYPLADLQSAGTKTAKA